MKLDLSDSKEYLEALKLAENFPSIFDYASREDNWDGDQLLDEAMEAIHKWCPHLWPQIDRFVLAYVSEH